ncbi:MAG: hypothetical protein QOI21_4104 [Actinomycetota bacterium]|jgi:hypothetical protein|nr:hypothetical protein [Actinomycetota bacterium]
MTDTSGSSGPEEPGDPKPEQNVPPDQQPTPPRGVPLVPPTPPGQWEQPPPQPGQQWTQAPGYPQAPPPQNRAWHPLGLGKPGVIALRPLNLGDILDGAITAIRKYPLLILGVSAVVAVVSALLNLGASLWLLPDLQQVATLDPNSVTQQEALDQVWGLLGSTSVVLGVTLVITLLTQTFLSGFLTVVMGKAVLGRPVTFADAMTELKTRFVPLLGVTVLYALAVLAGAILCLIPAIPVYVFFALASPALILERARVGQAFGRSRKLVSGSFWRVFGILLLATVISWAISFVIGIPFSLGGGAFNGIFNPGEVPSLSTGALILQAVGEVISQTIVAPFIALVTVLVYIDQRMRKEGMDIELARAAGVTPPQSW